MAESKKSSGSNLNFLWIFGLIMAILTIVFAIQNSEPQPIKFFTFEREVPVALLIFLCLAIGAVLTMLFSIPGQWRKKRERDVLKKRIKELESKLISNQTSTEIENPQE